MLWTRWVRVRVRVRVQVQVRAPFAPITLALSKPNSYPTPNQVPRFTTFAREEAATALAAREASRIQMEP